MRMLVAIVLAVVLSASGRAFAEPTAAQAPLEQARAVALLPLDADAKLELFGQPVASEVARALVAGRPRGRRRRAADGGAGQGPRRRRWHDQGGQGHDVELAVRLRDVRTGEVLDTIPVEAASMTAMDRAAEELSAKVLPSVKTHLAALIEKDQQLLQPKHDEPKHVEPPASRATVLAAIFRARPRRRTRSSCAPRSRPSSHRAGRASPSRAARARHPPARQRARRPWSPSAPTSRSSSTCWRSTSPPTRCRSRAPAFRVTIVDPPAVVFDRVVATDTVVGEARTPIARSSPLASRARCSRSSRSSPQAQDPGVVLVRALLVVGAARDGRRRGSATTAARCERGRDRRRVGERARRSSIRCSPPPRGTSRRPNLAEAHRLAGLAAFFQRRTPDAETLLRRVPAARSRRPPRSAAVSARGRELLQRGPRAPRRRAPRAPAANEALHGHSRCCRRSPSSRTASA